MSNPIHHFITILVVAFFVVCAAADNKTIVATTNISNPLITASNRVIEIKYLDTSPLKMNYSDFKSLDLVLTFNKNQIANKDTEHVIVSFITVPITPDFSILKLNGQDKTVLTFTIAELQSNKFTRNANLLLYAQYIGHSLIKLDSIVLINKYSNQTKTLDLLPEEIQQSSLKVTITKDEGVFGLIFKISVALLITISYINLGAQLDIDNMREVIKKPMPLLLGLLISIFVMPIMSWSLTKFLLGDQLIFRVGAFVFASGPAASASTLWAAMLDSDKELSVGLQVASTLSGLVSMPMLFYFMDTALEYEGNAFNSSYAFNSPYGRLISALILILAALLIGWYFIGRNAEGQKISRKIFKPLTFTILLFIIIYSSILYWHIYYMFNWTITLTTFLITITTYLISAILGSLINCNKDTSIAISIGSTYKNSGIAFGVLFLAFDEPDLYIAYVPCLTQVLTTSLVLYIFYLFFMLFNYLKRCGQPEIIQATTTSGRDVGEFVPGEFNTATQNAAKECRSDLTSSGKCVEENEELVAMNVTDSVPGSPISTKQSETIDLKHHDSNHHDFSDAQDVGGIDIC